MKFRIEWYEKYPFWAEVEANSRKEALEKATRGEFLPNTIDSDPGDMVGKYKAVCLDEE